MSHLIEDETRLHVAPTGDRYRIQFFQEYDPTPPWEFEGAVPLIWYSGGRRGGGFNTEGSRGFDLLNPLPYLSDAVIRKNLDAIAGLFGYATGEGFDSDARAGYRHDMTLREARREFLEGECLGDGQTDRDRLDALAQLWEMAGVPAKVIESRGYSQGDWAALLIVAHPEAVKAWGFKDMAAYRKACFGDDACDLRKQAHEWGAWCWGGVLGYSVAWIDPAEWAEYELDDESTDAEVLNDLAECEDVDSCWGFYPEGGQDYFPLETRHAYTLEVAVDAANHDARKRAAKRADQMAASIAAARPDLAPIWEGVQA